MSDLIRIQSTMNITVTAGLQHQDVSSPDAHVADRLKVIPEWFKGMCKIHEGVGNYPAFIAEWPTVKSLVKNGILTISGDAMKVTEEEKEEAAKVEAGVNEMSGRRNRRKSDVEAEEVDEDMAVEADEPEETEAVEPAKKSLEEIMAEKIAAKEGE